MNNPNQHSGMERGLLKQCAKKKGLIEYLNEKIDKETKISLNLLMKYGGKEACKEYYFSTEKYMKGYVTTYITDYENKNGYKHKAHMYDDKYIGPIKD